MECITSTKTLKCMFLRWTTIGHKHECGHKTSRRADMNLRFEPHFRAKKGQFFVPASQKMRLCVDVIWRHSCSYVVLPINMYISSGLYQYKSSYWHHTLSNLSHCTKIYRVGDNKRTVNMSTVRTFLISWGQKTCKLNIVILIYRHDMRSGLQ